MKTNRVISFQCCFCHAPIAGDVHALILVTNWSGPKDEQRPQQWFCHAECFTTSTGERIDVLESAPSAETKDKL